MFIELQDGKFLQNCEICCLSESSSTVKIPSNRTDWRASHALACEASMFFEEGSLMDVACPVLQALKKLPGSIDGAFRASETKCHHCTIRPETGQSSCRVSYCILLLSDERDSFWTNGSNTKRVQPNQQPHNTATVHSPPANR